MKRKQKANIELTLKNMLYFIDDKNEQDKAIKILMNCEKQMSDSRLKNLFDKTLMKTKNTYYDKVDFLVDDILFGNHNDKEKRIIYATIEKFKPEIEKAQSNFWVRLKDLLGWS